MTRAPIDPDVSDAEWEIFKEDERYEPPEPPRLFDGDLLVADDEEDDEDWDDEDEDDDDDEDDDE